MTNIKQIYTCPKCEESITSPNKPNHCPGCGYKFSLEGLVDFFLPTTVTEQAERIGDDKEHKQFLLEMPISSACNIMQDALNIIEIIPGKKVKVTDIRTIMGMAIKIGEVAKKYEDFLAAGGTHVPGLFITSGESENEQQATTHGNAATARVPTPLFLPVEQGPRDGDDIIPR